MGVIPSRQEAVSPPPKKEALLSSLGTRLDGRHLGMAALECGMTNGDCSVAPRPKNNAFSQDIQGRVDDIT